MAALRGCHDSISDQSEQKLGPAFADKKLATLAVEQDLHIRFGFCNNRHQRIAGRIIPALIIRNGGKFCRGLNNTF